jgi:hypothetical protein
MVNYEMELAGKSKFDEDIYNEDGIYEYIESDEICAEEEGFMMGYLSE